MPYLIVIISIKQRQQKKKVTVVIHFSARVYRYILMHLYIYTLIVLDFRVNGLD